MPGDPPLDALTWTAALAATHALGLALGSPPPCSAPTGLGATVIVPGSPATTLPGGVAPTDVVIQVHTAKAGCVGTGRWTGSAVAVALWADDPTTESVEGFVAGEPAEIVVIDKQTGAVFRGDEVEVVYEDGYDMTAGLEIDRVYVVSESGAGDETDGGGEVSVGTAEGWAVLAAAGGGTDFLSPLWTQGHPGADDENGAASVYQYSPSTGLAPLAVAPGDLPTGAGVVTYLFSDDDPETPGVDGFPKTLPGPAEPLFPFSFPLGDGPPADDAPSDGEWHLLGNPSGGFLDWDADGWDRSDVTGVVYVYDGSQYRSWNGRAGSLGSGVIAPGQGFWVRSTSGSPSLTAPASARRESGVAAGNDAEDHGNGSGVIHMELEDGGGVRSTLSVVPVPGGDFALDALDALALRAAQDVAPRLVAWAGGPARPALEVAAVPTYEELLDAGEREWEVELDVLSPTKAEDLTVSWSSASVPDGWSLELTDTVTGTTVDLLSAGSYRFDAPANVRGGTEAPTPPVLAPPPAPSEIRPADLSTSTGGPRFVLRARNERALAEPLQGERVTTLHPPAPNPVRSTTSFTYELEAPGPARLSVFDALGRQVAVVHDVAHASGPQSVRFDASQLSAGVYVLRLESSGSPIAAPMTVVR